MKRIFSIIKRICGKSLRRGRQSRGWQVLPASAEPWAAARSRSLLIVVGAPTGMTRSELLPILLSERDRAARKCPDRAVSAG